ncbi:MAG: sodium/solute symporter, partial [Candidatus Hydrogenedens sp.]|nr:sodium/solute symporter [Candidatus Hydrogenedens sp.]
EDYFLAGRGLTWPLIGLSIVAANLSTEQFVGMAGQSAGGVGLAVSNWQLTGSVGIIIVAFVFLPRFLRAGIYTMPEYLEYRYNAWARAIMAVYTVAVYVLVTTATVLYSGGLTLHTIFGLPLVWSIWLIGAIAAVYTVWGGLKAVAWADLFQGAGLLLGGLVTLLLGFRAVGGAGAFFTENADRLHMILPSDHPDLPWTGLLAGMWIPIFYYCGLNQFIVQRTLAAKTLRQGQLGIIFAAAMWVAVPFVIVLPGIMARQLYGGELATPDQAYPTLIRNLVPAGLRGFMFAAIAGAVVSSLASMLNSASTVFTMDLYRRHLRPDAPQARLVGIGRAATLVFVVIGCLIAPFLGHERFNGVFNYIQEFQGYISPGILAVFVFGFAVRRAPAAAGAAGLLLSAPVYGLLQWRFGDVAYLNRMAVTFAAVIAVMALMTLARPNPAPKPLPVREDIDTRPDPVALAAGCAVLAAVAAFYIVFW